MQTTDMPSRAPTPCRHPGCARLVAKPGRCAEHQSLVHRDYGRARRGFDAEVAFYNSTSWRSVRAAVLREQPLCAACAKSERVVAARVVDHVLPIKRGGARFDVSNLQALCVPCHNRKSARERVG